MTNRGFTNIPPNIIEAIDRLVTASYKLGAATQDSKPEAVARLQQHEDMMYDNLLVQIDNRITKY